MRSQLTDSSEQLQVSKFYVSPAIVSYRDHVYELGDNILFRPSFLRDLTPKIKRKIY